MNELGGRSRPADFFPLLAISAETKLLGLYDDAGSLNHVGYTPSLTPADHRALAPKLEALVEPPDFTGRASGPSRWSNERSTEW